MAKRFVFNITDEHADLLEAHRKSFGLRSAAEALRHLIDTSPNARARIGAAASVRVRVADDDFTSDARVTANSTAQPMRFGPTVGTLGSVQVGPTTPEPGSRLKAEKGKK